MHTAVIPARMGSQGFPFKNRRFFDYTADFLDNTKWYGRTIVSTDDPVVKELAQKRGYDVHERPEHLAGPAVSIKAVFTSVIDDMDIEVKSIVWLLYLPLLYKNRRDFEICREIIERPKVRSLCSFIRAKSHPYNCWKYDEKNGELSQYIENDVFRRQDLPAAWAHYHYVCCFKPTELDKLNSELINSRTWPYFLEDETRDNLIELDTPEDYEKWIRANRNKSGS
jgi:CMP-N-acetylneuraminic acid synthetase